MKRISKVQSGEFLARKVGSGEVGILRASGKRTMTAIYWNSKEEAIADLEAVIAYFKSEDE